MVQGLIYKGSYFFWKLKGNLKRFITKNDLLKQEHFLIWSGILILIGWFILILLSIFYPNILN